MCNMDFNSDFDVSADSGVGYESDISSDSNFEGLDTVDDSNYESFDKKISVQMLMLTQNLIWRS